MEEEEENRGTVVGGLPKNNSSHSSSDDMRVERLRRSADIGPAVAVYQKGLEAFEGRDYHQATMSFQSALEILQGIDGDVLSPSNSSSCGGSVGGGGDGGDGGGFPEGPPQRPAHTTTRRSTTRARARKRYPLEIAMCYNNLGQISKRLGNLQDALLQYHEARFVLVSMGSALDGPMRSLLGETYNNIGCTNHEQGNLEEALIYYTQARKTDQEQEDLLHQQQQQSQDPHEDEDDDDDEESTSTTTSKRSRHGRRRHRHEGQRPSKNLAITFNNIASVYRDMGKTQEASLYFGKAVVVMDQVLASSTSTLSLVTGGGADLAIARMYQNHADLLQPEQALLYYEKAWYSVQTDDDDNDNDDYDYSDTDEETKTFLALLSNKLATAHHHNGNLEKAFRYYQKAKSLLSCSSSTTKRRENSQQLALAMHNSAVVLYLLGGGGGASSDDDNSDNNGPKQYRLQEAWEYGVRAKELWSSSSTLVLAETHNCLAAILLQQRFLDKARVAVVSSRRLLESSATPPHHPTVLNATYLWGEICMETGQHDSALEAAHSVLQLQQQQQQQQQEPQQQQPQENSKPIGWLVQRWAQHIRARIQTRQGRYDQALSIYDDCLRKNPHDAESHFYKLQTRVLLLIELEKQWIRQKQQPQQQTTTTTNGRPSVVAHQEINRELGSCSVQLKTAIQALETEYGRQSPSGQQQQSEKAGKESQTSNHSNLFVLSLPESNRLDGEAVVQKLKHLRARYSLFQTASARTLQVPKEDEEDEDDGNGKQEGDSKEAETNNDNGDGSPQETTRTEWGDDNNATTTEEDHLSSDEGGGGWLNRREQHHYYCWHDMFASTLAEGPKDWQEILLENCRLDNTREYMESVAMELKSKLMSMHGLKGSLETTDRQMTATLTVALSAVGLVALAGGDDNNNNNKDSPTSVATTTTTMRTRPQWDPSILERWHRLSFYDLADFVSASQEEEVDVLLQRVVLDWAQQHADLVRSLPRPETAFGASVRKSLFLGMRHVCHHMSSSETTGSWTYRVHMGCKALFDAVALKQRRQGGTSLKRRKPIPLVRNPASNPDCLPPDKLLHQRAMEYTFGNNSSSQNVTLESVQTQWFTAKPTSPAAVLGKVHSHMILELLLRREVKDILLGGDTRRNIRDDTRIQKAFETMTMLKNQHVVVSAKEDDDDDDDDDNDATSEAPSSLSNAPSPPSPTHQLQHLIAAKIQPVHG